MPEQPAWFFTFGVGHPLGHNVVVVFGEYEEARAMMLEHFGSKWAFQYPMEELAEQQAKYGYTVVATIGEFTDA